MLFELAAAHSEIEEVGFLSIGPFWPFSARQWPTCLTIFLSSTICGLADVTVHRANLVSRKIYPAFGQMVITYMGPLCPRP